MRHLTIKICSAALAVVFLLHTACLPASAETEAFEKISTNESETLGGTVTLYRHKKTGAEVVRVDNGSDRRQFAIGFKTPPTDSKGANHVLEHALFCGSEKYPTKNMMHYIQNGTASLILNGVTADDCTYYFINTANETEYYNMLDVYLNGIFHPLFLSDENIFRQQGIRIEYADGEARYNGVVYNELRIKNLNTEENSVNFLADKLYRAIYGDTAPSFSAGGELDAIKELTYEDLLRVYHTYYIPSNSMTYLAGNQDLTKTFEVLDAFFAENETTAPPVSFHDTKQLPQETVREYNITESTKTVDIGFMSSGVPASADANERYARDILFDIIGKKMEAETNGTKMYTSGGNSGGTFNLAMLLSEIPMERKNEIISAYHSVLQDLSENGIDENDIDTYIEKQQKYFYANWENVFCGLLYHGDPLAYTEMNAVCDDLKAHKGYFTRILKQYFTENPYSAVIISGNGSFGSEDSRANVSAEELEQLKRETEEFQKWNDAEDDPAVIDKIPFLTLDEVKNPPDKSEPQHEQINDISFYHTAKEGNSTSLYFPLAIEGTEFDYVQLMQGFLGAQADKKGLRIYTMLSALENAENPQEINPHFLIGFFGENPAEALENVISFLQSEQMWNADDLEEYIKTTPQKIIGSYYDPYFLSSALKGSALSAGGRFGWLSPANNIIKGSPHYCHFLKTLNANDAPDILEKLKETAGHIILRSKPIVEYIGTDDNYSKLQTAVTELFTDAGKRKNAKLALPIGCCSAATITSLADANHFMLAASYGKEKYSGKMAVLGKVLSTKYITPTMRGKYGAYGCNISFRDNEMVSAVTGLSDIDFALTLWQGMGDYLRNLKMTQKELDAFIVSAVQEYEEWDFSASEYGAEFALQNKTSAMCEKIRNEMLQTTVDDLKNYADFVDELVAQKRVFAVLGKSAADSAKFDFAYYGNADTLEVTPRLTKNPGRYISGRSENLFAPDSTITRAEAAAMLSQLTADTRAPQGEAAFADIPDGAWYHDAVLSLCEKGIFSGCGDDLWQPDRSMTRAEFSAALSKFLFDKDTEMKTSYSDVNPNAWYYAAMAAMVNGGFLTGYDDGTLRPEENVTRAEAVTVINRMLGISLKENGENPFKDVSSAHWAYRDILAAVK